jgi:outer membrane protein
LKANRRWSLTHRSGLLHAPAVFAAVMICSFNTPAYSQEAVGSPHAASENKSAWIVTLGGSVEYGPPYVGSKHSSFSAMPSFDIRRLGEPAGYSSPDDSIDYSLLDFHGFEAGPVVGIRGGRSSSDDQRLTGLDTIHWGLDAGAFAQYWPIEDRLRLRAEGRQGLRAGDGLVADLSLDWFQPIGDSLVLSAGPRLSLGNDAHMRRNFGISQRESAANGVLPAFDAQGGIKSVGLTVAATYTISPAWSVQVYDRYDRLTADAAESPITSDIGSKDQNIIGFAINRSFEIDF